MPLGTEKITISLPKEDLKMVTEYKNKLHLPQSALFRQAIKLWLKVMEKEEMRKKYITVYSNNKIRKKQLERAEEMLSISSEILYLLFMKQMKLKNCQFVFLLKKV